MPPKIAVPWGFFTNRSKENELGAKERKRARGSDDDDDEDGRNDGASKRPNPGSGESSSQGSEHPNLVSAIIEPTPRPVDAPGQTPAVDPQPRPPVATEPRPRVAPELRPPPVTEPPALPPRTPPPKPPGPGPRTPYKTPLSRLTLTPTPIRDQRRAREQREEEDERRRQAELESQERDSIVQASIEALRVELHASGVTPDEQRDGNDQVVFSASHLERLLDDNQNLRKQLRKKLKDGPTKPLILTDQQKVQMRENLRAVRQIHEEHIDRAQREGRTYEFPSLMSQANALALPEDHARQCFDDLVVRIRRIVWENMDPDLARNGLRASEPSGQNTSSLPGLEFCVDDTTPYLQDNNQPELVFILLEAYIWYRVQRYIFDAPEGAWNSRPFRPDRRGGPLPGPGVPIPWGIGFGPALFSYFGEAKRIVKAEFPGMLPQLHQLRAKFATFFDRLHGDPQWPAQVAAINEVFSKNLVDFVRQDKITQYLRSALEIIDAAMKLDVRMRRCVADWEMRPRQKTRELISDRNWRFSQAHMVVAGSPDETAPADETNTTNPVETPQVGTADAAPGEENKTVSLIVSPGLLRAGTERGGDYTLTEAVVKCRVVIDPNEFQREYPLPAET